MFNVCISGLYFFIRCFLIDEFYYTAHEWVTTLFGHGLGLGLWYSTPLARRVWRCQRGNQKPYIEEEQTTQWPKEKVQKDKQRSTKHTYKTNDRVTRTPLKTVGE
jgi:hypothetical protein